MKILFVTGLTGYGIGGARAETIRLLRGMAERGHDVALAVDVMPQPLQDLRHFKLTYPPDANAPAQMAEAVKAFEPELVHVVAGGSRLLVSADKVLSERAGGGGPIVPWIFTLHNVPPAERIFSWFFGRPKLHYALRDAKALASTVSWRRILRTAGFRSVIAHSTTVAKNTRAAGCPPEKIVHIPFGCDPDLTAAADPKTPSPFPAGASPRILTVAGVAPHKGQLDSIRAVAKLLADYPNLTYVLIGMARDKRYRDYLQKTIRELGYGQRLLFLHRASDEVKFAALRDADLYIQPSHEEGFCIAFTEAAMMVPRLVGTDTGEIAAVAEGDPGAAVVPPMDVAGLERAARTVLNAQLPPDLIARRRQRLTQKYSWHEYLEKHVALYQQTIGAGAASVALPGAMLAAS